jgi:hypothetical protein
MNFLTGLPWMEIATVAGTIVLALFLFGLTVAAHEFGHFWAARKAGLVVLVGGAPLRSWITAKLKINPTPDPTKLFWRVWHRFGLWGLGVIAPVTIGPQATAAIALALGESALRIQVAISLGVLPWTLVFALLTATGAHALK